MRKGGERYEKDITISRNCCAFHITNVNCNHRCNLKRTQRKWMILAGNPRRKVR